MIRTVSDLINELGNIRDRLTSSDIPVSVDGKEIYSVELVDDGGYKAVIKTDLLIDGRLNDKLVEFLSKNPTQEELRDFLIRMVNEVTDERNAYLRTVSLGKIKEDNPFVQYPECGSFNYEVGLFSSYYNCKCRDCGTLFFWNFNM